MLSVAQRASMILQTWENSLGEDVDSELLLWLLILRFYTVYFPYLRITILLHTSWCHSKMVDFLQNPHSMWGQDVVYFWEYKPWIILCHSHYRAVCNNTVALGHGTMASFCISKGHVFASSQLTKVLSSLLRI